jgi:hypothetical protein
MRCPVNAYLFLTVFVLLGGCTLAEVNVEVLSERTALENQVLGTYNALDTEMLLVASVRGVDSQGKIGTPPRHSQDHKDAIAAMQVMDFHADDLQRFLALGWAGEANDGLVEPFAMVREGVDPSLKEFSENYTRAEFDSVIGDINQSREVIMGRVVHMNENFSREDTPEIRRIFGRLNGETAAPGTRIQLEDDSWTIKKW